MFKLAVVILALVALINVSNALDLGTNPLVKLDRYLASKTNSEEIKDNFGLAREYLEKKEDKKLKIHSTDLIKKFISLESLVNKCDESAAKDLMLELPSSLHAFRRLPALIKKLSKKHGENCKQEYVANLFKSLEEMEDVAQEVTFNMENVIEYEVFPDGRQYGEAEQSIYALEHIAKNGDILTFMDSQQAYMGCGLKEGYESKNPRETLEDCIIKPCEVYADRLENIFAYVKNDDIAPTRSVTKQDEIIDREFFKHWAQFSLCKSFIRRGLDKMVQDLVVDPDLKPEPSSSNYISPLAFSSITIAAAAG